jgi:hypothetical protein
MCWVMTIPGAVGRHRQHYLFDGLGAAGGRADGDDLRGTPQWRVHGRAGRPSGLGTGRLDAGVASDFDFVADQIGMVLHALADSEFGFDDEVHGPNSMARKVASAPVSVNEEITTTGVGRTAMGFSSKLRPFMCGISMWYPADHRVKPSICRIEAESSTISTYLFIGSVLFAYLVRGAMPCWS